MFVVFLNGKNLGVDDCKLLVEEGFRQPIRSVHISDVKVSIAAPHPRGDPGATPSNVDLELKIIDAPRAVAYDDFGSITQSPHNIADFRL